MPKKTLYTKPPHPEKLKTFAIPGYLMPIIAEWLQISTSSAYSFFKADSVPSRSTMTKLAQSPYFLPITLWDEPASIRAETAYIRWYDRQDQQIEQNQELNNIL